MAWASFWTDTIPYVPLGDETGVYTAPALRRWIECLMQENKNFVLS